MTIRSEKQKAIGLFDSGMGGLTVLEELVDVLPEENFIYFGDTARLPYGNKSPQTVAGFAFENASFLLEQQIKLLVIACQTACSHALSALQQTLPIPVLGVTNPGVEQLIQTTQTNSVAVLGTTSTIESNVFQSLLHKERPDLHIYPIACPLFVPIVEEGLQHHPAAQLIAEHYLSPLRNTPVDSVLLACTHYPLLSPVIQSVLGPSTKLIAPARGCALEVRTTLKRKDLLNPAMKATSHRFYVSKDPIKFRSLAKPYFSKPIKQVTLVQNEIL